MAIRLGSLRAELNPFIFCDMFQDLDCWMHCSVFVATTGLTGLIASITGHTAWCWHFGRTAELRASISRHDAAEKPCVTKRAKKLLNDARFDFSWSAGQGIQQYGWLVARWASSSSCVWKAMLSSCHPPPSSPPSSTPTPPPPPSSSANFSLRVLLLLQKKKS